MTRYQDSFRFFQSEGKMRLPMHPLLPLLFLLLPSLGITVELNVETRDGNSLQLSGFLSHEQFYTALSSHIGIKVRNATQATLSHSKQDIDGLLTQIDYMEYTFLQIFHSLAMGDLPFANQLIELYSTFGQPLRLSNCFTSSVTFLTEPTYSALNSISNLNRKGLKSIPAEVINAVVSVTNKSSVFEDASRRANVGVMKWLQHHVSETERCSALERAWHQHKYDVVVMLIKSNITFVNPGMSVINRKNSKGESILHLAAEARNPQFVARLLASGEQVNISDESGTTPLFRAVKNNDVFTAKILIQKKADVNAATMSGNVPLHEAARNGNHEMATLLLASGSSVGKETDEGLTPLLISEKYVFREIIEYLFYSNSITVKELHNDLRFLYLATSYESTNRTTRRRKINLDHISEHSMIVKELLLRGEKAYFPKDIKSRVSNLVMKLGITKLARSMFNIGATLDPKEWQTIMNFKNAIANGNYELTSLMLEEGMPENTEIEGISALEVAADNGRVTVFNLLLKRGADINKVHKGVRYMLHGASSGGGESIVRYLLNNGYRADSLDRDGNTPLIFASMFDNSDIVKLLIDYKANPNAKNSDKETPLHFAAYGNAVKSINILIENRAEIDARTKDGKTPLFIAAEEGGEASIARLLDAGAAIDAKDNANRTPLEISIVRKHFNTTRLLLDRGANPNIMDSHSRTYLHKAVSMEKIEMVELLLKGGVLINAPDSNGRNALHEAVAKSSLSIVQLLVTKGISINAKDKDGKTPLDYAIAKCSRGIVSFLVQKGGKASTLADPKCIIGD